jgi:hypothetical protein
MHADSLRHASDGVREPMSDTSRSPLRSSRRERAERKDTLLQLLAPPAAISIPKWMPTVMWTRWPSGVHVRVVQNLLDVVDQLRLRIRQVQRAHLRGPSVHTAAMGLAYCRDDVSLEETDHARILVDSRAHAGLGGAR